MSTTRNILVIGATGVIGKFITEQLVLAKSRAGFEKIAILTSPSTVEKKADEISKLKENGVQVIVGDVTKEADVKSAYEGIDTIISAVGRNVIANQIDLLKWAATTPNIKKFFPSEYGTDIEYSSQSANEKPHQQKLKVRKYISEGLKDSDMEITYLVTGPYSDMYLGKGIAGNERAGSLDVKGKKAFVVGDGKGKVSFTTMKDVGVLLVAALVHPAPPSTVRTLKVNSFTSTPLEIVREFEKQTGDKWEVQCVPMEEVRKTESERWEKQDPLATLWTLRRIWAEGGTLYDARDNGKIGEPKMEGLESQVKLSIEKQLKALL